MENLCACYVFSLAPGATNGVDFAHVTCFSGTGRQKLEIYSLSPFPLSTNPGIFTYPASPLYSKKKPRPVLSTLFLPESFLPRRKSVSYNRRCLEAAALADMASAAGAGIPAFYTPTALGTKLTEGKEVREFNGRQYVLETALGADFAFIGADRADRWGNVSSRGTQENFGPSMAMGSCIAIIEAKHVTDEPIPPREVDIPGIYVQRILQVPTKS